MSMHELSALHPDRPREIADAVDAAHFDQQASTAYMNVGTRVGGLRAMTFADLEAADDAGAFDSPEIARLNKMFADLTDAARFELVALMWIGRSDGEASHFTELKVRAERNLGARATHYAAGKAPLAATCAPDWRSCARQGQV